MKIVHIVTMFLIAMAFLNLTGCNRASKSNDERQRDVAVEKEIANFWGHGTRTFISDNLIRFLFSIKKRITCAFGISSVETALTDILLNTGYHCR